MSPFDAYQDEMSNLDGLSDRDLDRLIRLRSALDADGVVELAALLRDVRVAYTEPPGARIAATHLSAVGEETARLRAAHRAVVPVAAAVRDPGSRAATRSSMSRKRFALATATVLFAIPLLTAGLAVAGVSLPDAARAPFETVGIDLPNQSQAGDVHAVIDATAPDERGCDFGQAVAAAASGARAQPPEDPCARGGAASAKSDQGGAGGQGGGSSGAGRAFGQATAQDAQENASTDGQAFGQRTSEGAQQLAPDHPSGPPEGAGSPEASGEPQGSPDTGQSESATGRSTAQGTPAGDRAP